nr:altronate dehydratase family protein [uncultured Caproiciproducens sp.]
MKNAIQIHEKDNTAVALTDLKKGETVVAGGIQILLKEDIGRGHKLALADIEEGENVIKYGYPIGQARQKISCGSWIHSHNLKTNLDISSENYTYKKRIENGSFPDRQFTFKGYRRFDGSVGIRNEIWIIPTVGCVNEIGEQIIRKFCEQVKEIHADSLKVLKHNYGCSQLGDDLSNTRRILADFARHPNAGGVLILSLGCENNTLPEFVEEMGSYDKSCVRFLKCQSAGDEIEEGARLLAELNDRMRQDKRETCSLTELKVGMKCGGSDGLSGITANPLIGAYSDFLTGQGGTSVLTEVPEMFGAETILMNRARDESVFHSIVSLIQNFKHYFTENHQPVYENPSPGNKEGGITTLEEKSLGCVQKAGSAVIEDVLDYGRQIQKKGLNLLCAPGNDLVSCSALAAAGCQIILFSTGRGTPFGTMVPTVKISTNTQLYEAKPSWIDFDAGKLVAGADKIELLEELIQFTIDTANGTAVRNESNHFSEIAIWKNGVTL